MLRNDTQTGIRVYQQSILSDFLETPIFFVPEKKIHQALKIFFWCIRSFKKFKYNERCLASCLNYSEYFGLKFKLATRHTVVLSQLEINARLIDLNLA